MRWMVENVSYEEAKSMYCKGWQIWLDGWRVPCAGEYGSHASAESLFYRSLAGKNRNGKFTAKVPANFRDALN